MIYCCSVLGGIWLPSQTPTSVAEEGGRQEEEEAQSHVAEGPHTWLGAMAEGSPPALPGGREGASASLHRNSREPEETRVGASRTFPRSKIKRRVRTSCQVLW